ncbi:MAG: 3-deoxy-8-phosphooctulonate synthase [Deltaproteobacteria bacterium]
MGALRIRFAGHDVGDGCPLLLIAGPCVATTRDELLSNARRVRALAEKHGVPVVFKASLDKANRTTTEGYRGPGFGEALELLAAVKREVGLSVITDVHECAQVGSVAEVADAMQIPAFLCKQTDLLLAAARTGKALNVKKGQFLAPEDMHGVLQKTRSAGNPNVLLTERGACLGYHNLVVDMRGLVVMRELGAPVCMDATHAVPRPGATADGRNTGDRQFVAPLARAAAAVGIDALFCEVHEDPKTAPSDGENACDFPLLDRILGEVLAVRRAMASRAK